MTLLVEPVVGIAEIVRGDDLGAIIVASSDLRPADVVVVTSKIVSKAAGLTSDRPKAELMAAQTDRVVAHRGDTQIVRTHHGLTMAAAGIDNSNTAPGTLITLPEDPDESARQIRARIAELAGVDIAVVITDTAGRAWRTGQTDIAIGCAGIVPLDSFAGRLDHYGNLLAVTAPAIADEIAAAAELVAGKMGGQPVVIVRGTDPAWHLTDDGPGAQALVRPEDADMFGLGAREAAVAAILGDRPVRGLPLAEAVTTDDLVDLALRGLGVDRSNLDVGDGSVQIAYRSGDGTEAGVLSQRLISLGIAHGVSIDVRVTRSRRPGRTWRRRAR